MGRTSSRKSFSGTSAFPSGSSSAAISQALKIRRYIDIQLKDVIEEKFRGKWTDEDDKLWRATKPYECEICGERGSTRYNNNRHKLNKHATKKTIKCPDPGCKLSFTRPDNLVKHQKKHHNLEGSSKASPEPAVSRIAPKLEDSMDDLISEFRRFPIADDLPLKPVSGLKQYYIPDKLPFLPPEVLSHYADYYFSPTTFHPHLPLLHQSTFQPASVLASFLRAVCAIGGLYDPTNQTLSGQLWESGWRVMERWIARGPLEDDEDEVENPKGFYDRNGSGQGYYPIKQEFVRDGKQKASDMSMGIAGISKMPGSNAIKVEDQQQQQRQQYQPKKALIKAAERKEREGRLSVLQGLLLFAIYGLFSGDREKHKKARRLLARCVELARENDYFRGWEGASRKFDELTVQKQWETYIDRESRKRAAFTLYLLDCQMALFFDAPRLLRYSELKNLPLPCDAELFEAPTADEWSYLWESSSFHGSRAVSPPMFCNMLQTLLRGNGNEILRSGNLNNDFSALILVMALHMQILSLTQTVSEELEIEEDSYDDGDEFSHDGTNKITGESLAVFPHSKHPETHNLQKSLNLLGMISGYAHLFTLEFNNEVKPGLLITNISLNPVSFPTKTTATEASKLQGCGKAFHIAWHLAYIQLMVPDRMVLNTTGEVPMDLLSALLKTVQETKDRVFNANAATTLKAFTTMLEESDLLSHLLEIMRLLVAPYAEYDEEARSAEFPAVTAMLFKSLMVAWEVLGRTCESDDDEEDVASTDAGGVSANNNANNANSWREGGGFNWGPGAFVNGEDWMFAADGGMFQWDNNVNGHVTSPSIASTSGGGGSGGSVSHNALTPNKDRRHSSKPPSALEKFKSEILELLREWEKYGNDEGESTLTDEIESLDWRFLRWMRCVFAEMECWDFGKTAVDALDQLFDEEDNQEDVEEGGGGGEDVWER